MKSELKPYIKQIKAIERVFRHNNIYACINDVKETNEKIMYYIEYTRFINPYSIALIVDSFAIALGGVKLVFIPVIENKPYSAFMVDKLVDEKFQIGIEQYKSNIEYKVIKNWVSNKRLISESILQNEFGLDEESANQIILRLEKEKIIYPNKFGMYSTIKN